MFFSFFFFWGGGFVLLSGLLSFRRRFRFRGLGRDQASSNAGRAASNAWRGQPLSCQLKHVDVLLT